MYTFIGNLEPNIKIVHDSTIRGLELDNTYGELIVLSNMISKEIHIGML